MDGHHLLGQVKLGNLGARLGAKGSRKAEETPSGHSSLVKPAQREMEAPRRKQQIPKSGRNAP